MNQRVWKKEPIPEYKSFRKNFPNLSEKFEELVDQSLKKSELSRKTQELIIIALLAGKFENGFKFHIKEALKHGANKEEILGTLILTLPYSDISTFLESLSWAEDEDVV